ncbi:S8 family serine peptidase [Roseivirga sp. BDSF3-8]|uniref:S8 family serine peptidase n=1 Tax=Roseivirga sp. BDSF3-8 TaxID=3241598 RepID=UPI00353226FE
MRKLYLFIFLFISTSILHGVQAQKVYFQPSEENLVERGENEQPIQGLPQYAEDRLFVKFENLDRVAVGEFSNRAEKNAVMGKSSMANRVASTLANPAVLSFQRALPGAESADVAGIYTIAVDQKMSTASDLVSELQNVPGVVYAERAPIYYSMEVPNDPLVGLQYSLPGTHSFRAFDAFTGSGRIVVAVVDDAVLTSHEDLADNIWINPGETGMDAEGNDKASNGIDDDGNGYVDDWRGWDAADNDNDPNPPITPTPGQGNQARPGFFFHGTFVAGIVGAVTGNGIGKATTSYNQVEIMAVKATINETTNVRSLNNTFGAVQYAVAAGAQVVNMSFGGSSFSQAYQDLINYGTSQGMVFIAAAGNDGADVVQYPAAYDNVIAVANTTSNDLRSGSSNFGDWVDIAAPGSSVLSTAPNLDDPNGTYQYSSGTSFSSPHVASLTALVLAQNPSLTPAEVEALLENTADNVDLKNPGFEEQLGAGRIDAYAAVVAAGGTALEPVAGFVVKNFQEETFINEPVQMINESSTTANVSYSWSFPGGSPSTSSAENPQVTYSAPGMYDVTLTVTDEGGTNSYTMEGAVNVQSVLPADILDYPFEEAIGATTISGHSGNNIPMFANRFSYPDDRVITGARFSFLRAIAGGPNSTLSVVVWDFNSEEEPGDVLYKQAYNLNDIEGSGSSTVPAYHDFVFDNPVDIPDDGNFYIGLEINYGTGDVVTVHHYLSNGLRTYLFFQDNWRSYNDAGGGNFDFTMLMFPVVADPALLPSGDFTQSADELCTTDELMLDASSYTQADMLQWETPGGNPESGTGETFTVVYPAAGEYMPTLRATNMVDVEKDGVTIPVGLRVSEEGFVRVGDCEGELIADFEADAITVPLGTTVQFTNLSQNATNYDWYFEGGDPLRSTETNPAVTFNKVGTFNVRLRSQAADGQTAVEIKDDYITVFAPGDDCFQAGKPFATPFSNFTFTAGGSVSGHNALNVSDYARRFSLEPGAAVNSVLYSFLSLDLDAGAESEMGVTVWSVGQDGTPGELLHIQYVPVATLIANTDIEGGNDEYTILLDESVTVPANGELYVGYRLQYDNMNEVAVNLGAIGSSSGAASGFVYQGGWLTYGGIGLPADLAIAVGGVEDANEVPVASFTLSDMTAFVGESIQLDATSSENTLVYEWSAPGGNLESDVQPVTSVSFDAPGTYEITLRVFGNCDSKFDEVVKSVTIEAPCSPAEVVYFRQGSAARKPIPDQYTDPSAALGLMDDNFVSLGFGGELIVRFNEKIANGEGDDIMVYETSKFGADGNCEDFPETVQVFASQDGQSYLYLGTVCQDGSVDLGELGWAQYVKFISITDKAAVPSGYGYDLDALMCLNGTTESTEMADLRSCVATEVVSYGQANKKNGGAIAPRRTNPHMALGMPQENNAYNFVSLGYGGSIELKLDYAVFDLEGNDLRVVESTFFGNTCDNYPETANVYAKGDVNDAYVLLGEVCHDGDVDLASGGLEWAQYIKIVDTTDPNGRIRSGNADGYDVDGVYCLPGGGEAMRAGVQALEELPNVAPNEEGFSISEIYPNPFNNELSISIVSDQDRKLPVKMYDMRGTLVMESELDLITGQSTYSVGAEKLPAGMYLLRLGQENDIVEQIKVIKK